MRRLRTTRRPGKKEKSTPRPRSQKPEPGAPSVSRYSLETCRSVILSPTVMSTTSDPGAPADENLPAHERAARGEMDQRRNRRGGDRAHTREPFARAVSAIAAHEELQLGAPGRAAGDGERDQRAGRPARLSQERKSCGAHELPVHRASQPPARVHRARGEDRAAAAKGKISRAREHCHAQAEDRTTAAGSCANAAASSEARGGLGCEIHPRSTPATGH